LFGAFATAIFETILTSREKLHYAGLAMLTQWDSPGVSHLVAQAQQNALAYGASLGAAKAAVVLQLAGQVQKAAAIQAFDDCFFVTAMACLVAILPTLLIKRGASVEASGPVEA